MSPPHTETGNSPVPVPEASPMAQSAASPCQEGDQSLDDSQDLSASMSQDEDVDGVDLVNRDAGGWTLLTLPPEILLNIISFLDARVVVHRLSLVCKELHRLISNDATWKIRIGKRWPKQYPVTPVDDSKFNWQLACMEREEQYRLWSDPAKTEHFELTSGHFGEIDSVHLMQGGDLCISGSRDRSFHLWDLRKLDASNRQGSIDAAKLKSVGGHKGWVWHITSRDNIMCTASWDQWVKLWDINADCTAPTQGFRGSSAFLCSVLHQNEVHAGAYDKHIYMFDRRDDNQSSKLRLHKMPVLCLASDNDYIISGSEDMTIAVFDRRAGKLLKKIELDKFPMCMSYGLGQLWVGRKDGKVNVIDPTQGKFDIVQTYDVGHESKVTGILHSLGSVVTCSTDRTIKIHEPNHDPSPIRTIEHTTSLSAIHTNNGVLAAGGSDQSVNIWRPTRDEEQPRLESG
ncbi:F-box/WD repeat-containing protein 9-like [Patiria miniata]|uniref:F-box domain-containing protein n=1 Tax=Patiria miniata TaxID=46514 RepID=A0A913ZF51_PATMI|nr:F-box/WD repeat-containing protein 9-like [Patiria miniata]XP_038049595.1 F-box/WD repeat-containing protein 9-like [Patiria miniata]XP_038049596.1 F-box/WD repeat-containing protein 9-like [Patiria miniata]